MLHEPRRARYQRGVERRRRGLRFTPPPGGRRTPVARAPNPRRPTRPPGGRHPVVDQQVYYLLVPTDGSLVVGTNSELDPSDLLRDFKRYGSWALNTRDGTPGRRWWTKSGSRR